MSDDFIKRVTDNLSIMGRYNLTESAKTKSKYSASLHDFVEHLMSATHEDMGFKEHTLYEASFTIDHRKTNKLPPLPDAKGVHRKVDVLNHPAVAETDSAEHVARYNKLQKRGEALGKVHKNPHASIAKGFHAYMSGVGKGEDPRVTQRAQLGEANKAYKHHSQEVDYHAVKPKLLGSNTKIDKNEKEKDRGLGLTLSPARMANVGNHTACPDATKECENSCLAYTTGKNAMLSNVNSKINKHHFVISQPHHAARMIHKELLDHVDDVHAANKGKPKSEHIAASYRPNMVTDYNHAGVSHDMINHVNEYAKSKGVKFQTRDYTKSANRLYKPKPENYFMALSHTGSGHKESNDTQVGHALERGHTVAAVVHGDATHMYDHKNGRVYPMTAGDENDMIENRHKEVGHKVNYDGTGVHPKTGKLTGVVSALRIKGSSNAVKEAAGKFENHTTSINHPEHGHMRVVEINKPGAEKNMAPSDHDPVPTGPKLAPKKLKLKD
jgi:hypothetical protein